MPITQYTGKTLLARETIERIQKEVQGLLANKDVAAAYSASQHIKQELSGLPKEEVGPLLPEYRRITSLLKALALPVLAEEDVQGLLANNLEFLDTQSEPLLVAGLSAWLASQPDEAQEELKQKLASRIDQDSPFAPKLAAVLTNRLAEPEVAPEAAAVRDDGFLVMDERDDLSRSAQKARAVTTQASSDSDALSISRNLFSLSGSRAGEETFSRRASALVNSRLRDVRTAADFADYASRPFAAGGLGLSGDALARAEGLVEDAYNRSHGILSRHPERAFREYSGQAPSRAEGSGASSALDPSASLGVTDHSAQTAPPAPKPPLPAPAPAEPARAFRPLHNPAANGKPRLDDVKPAFVREPQPGAPRAMGLADELGTITLVDFRGFGDAKDAQEAILGKIATLEGESIGAKLAGIRSLRASPLFGRYLALVDSSLSGSRKLAEVLADPSANPERMTEDEFFAIADLAGKLK